MGGILYPQAENIAPVKVSSRAPVWGASFICLPRTVIRAVSSRAPVWGASEFLEGTTAAGKFQVVPPCGGHLEMAPNVIVRHLVSSRAPVWGASKNNGIPSRRCGFKSCPRVGGIPAAYRRVQKMISFKSCPRVGGIPRPLRAYARELQFQVVPPCGGHPTEGKLASLLLSVSSRAPVWGASAPERSE